MSVMPKCVGIYLCVSVCMFICVSENMSIGAGDWVHVQVVHACMY